METMIRLGLAIFPLVGCAAESTSIASQDPTTTENKRIVAEFFEKFSNGEIDPAFALVSDDVEWWVPGDLPFSGTKTKSEYLQVVGSIQQGGPAGLQLISTSMIAEVNQVSVEVESYGEHANGRTYNNQYHFLITIESGKIIEVKEYMDTLQLFQLIQP